MIREHIINNFKTDSTESIKEAITESIKEQDEVTLPGMGVFLTLLWEEAEEKDKERILELIRKGLDKTVTKE